MSADHSKLVAAALKTARKSLKTTAARTEMKASAPSRDGAIMKAHTAITPIEYGGLQEAYDHFNQALFDGTLPDVFITYQRKANSRGYFSPDRFSGRLGQFGKHELALNPDTFIERSDESITSTLVHEMAHVWQHAFGQPGARGYHNKQWAAKMREVGLQPSSTGAVGGRETGQRMTHYFIPDGPFTQAFAALAATGWKLNLQSAHFAGRSKAPPSKVKFTCCAMCSSNMWGKPDSDDICGACARQILRDRLGRVVAVAAMKVLDADKDSAITLGNILVEAALELVDYAQRKSADTNGVNVSYEQAIRNEVAIVSATPMDWT